MAKRTGYKQLSYEDYEKIVERAGIEVMEELRAPKPPYAASKKATIRSSIFTRVDFSVDVALCPVSLL